MVGRVLASASSPLPSWKFSCTILPVKDLTSEAVTQLIKYQCCLVDSVQCEVSCPQQCLAVEKPCLHRIVFLYNQPPPAYEVFKINVYTYTLTARCMPFVLLNLSPFEDAYTSRRVRYRALQQLCCEKDMMLVSQQT